MVASLARRKPLYLASLGGISAFVFLSLYFIYRRSDWQPTFSFFSSLSSSLHGASGNLADLLRLSTLDRPPRPEDVWTPLALDTCTFGMPAHFAPCVAKTLKNVLYAEELLYPDFEIREPYFAQEEHRKTWRSYAQSDLEFRARGALGTGWMRYRGQFGQNYVFHDVSYTTGSFGPDTWAPLACMSSQVNTSPIRPLNSADDDSSILPTVAIALSPDAWSFQHFMDRVTHIVGQGAHLTYGAASDDRYVLTGRRGPRIVQEMYARMGFPAERVLNQKPKVEAREMVFSCRAVLIHPWLSLKTLEMLGVERTAPSTTRNKVVYMSRSDGRATNGGRKVVNEAAVLEGITAFLAERNRGEELVMFNPDNYANVSELFSWFSENVIAVVGPHGGAMINHRWANSDILVLEFMPTTRIAMMIYEEASVLSQTYAAIVVEPTEPKGFDMEINVEDVVSLMRQHLGVVGSDSPVRKSYSWHAKEIGL